MVRSKAPSKKQPKRGVDFKKIKRKIGRKLPPPKNATNTEIKSKAIILPEQSVASEKMGLAVSKKGLTLKELLQQTSHHNAKVRKDALIGIRDLAHKYPADLRLHKLAIIEKLRERISDDDKVVRETLYELLKSVIFPGSKEILENYEDILRKNQIYLQDKNKLKNVLAGLHTVARGILHAVEPDVPKEHDGVSFIIKKLKDLVPVLVNCFQEFTPLVRSMALVDAQSFNCMLSVLQSIDLAVKFLVYGVDKHQTGFGVSVTPMYEGADITVWGGTTMLVLLKKLLDVFPLNPSHHLSEKDTGFEPVTSLHRGSTISHFQEGIILITLVDYLRHNSVFGSFGCCLLSVLLKSKTLYPSSLSADDDKYFTLNVGITEIFLHVSEWILLPAVFMEKFLQFIENALSGKICSNTRSSKALREKHLVSLLPFIPRLVSQVASNWKYRLLQAFTKAFKDCKPESSLNLACLYAIEEMLLPVVLHLQLRLGQCVLLNPSLAWEFDNMQNSLREFYSTCLNERSISYGPFVKLPRECDNLEPFVLFRIIEVLHSAYKTGHVQTADHISFFVTLFARFKVFPENLHPVMQNNEKISNREMFKSITRAVCSCLTQMGDEALVLQISQKIILDQISLNPPLDNMCAMLRMLVKLDSSPTRLPEQSIINLSSSLPGYLIDAASYIPEDSDEPVDSNRMHICQYYLLPCFFLFDRSDKLLNLVLGLMGSSLFPPHGTQNSFDQSSRIWAIVSILIFMLKDAKVQRSLSSCKAEIKRILQNILLLQVKTRQFEYGYTQEEYY
ncbi:hypothetical protein HHK36_015214 [Tetracentron sinense]|uniref:Uncharacterized protein n=1 Tax=Tetracentron sinense TaxID=13715 RepID=A0A835DGJ0_TETSI|nr:hypothetical protein HHK36_015214 [Tetracentron sinense]